MPQYSIEIPASSSFPQHLAGLILKQHQRQLPDLSHVHIFLPNALATQQLRYAFSQQHQGSILGLNITSLEQWLEYFSDNIEQKSLPMPGRQLILLDALKQYPKLFNNDNIWQVCDSLLALFDELSQYAAPLMQLDAQQWQSKLQQAYDAEHALHYLNQEAKLVHTLWQAWQIQLQEMQLLDASQAYQQALAQDLPALDKSSCFYVIHDNNLSQSELQFYQNLANTYELYFIQQTAQQSSTDKNTLATFLEQAYDHSHSLKTRAENFKQENDIASTLQLFNARSNEEEAQAVCLQSRLYLLDGYDNIAIITEDRKLARRVRAILEQDNIGVRDTAGWLLPTTSAATIIERWLECIEEDFAHQPMLDLLKSPFFCTVEKKDEHLALVYRFEQDIIQHENIPQNIQRYQQALGFRQRRLTHWNPQQFEQLSDLLKQLETQALPLLKLQQSQQTQSVSIFLNTLIDSLQQLHIFQQLEQDQAGQCILRSLEQMQYATEFAKPEMHWQDFRIWLANTLESQSFTPHNQQSPVQLMNMQQAQYCHFDAIIMASANKQNLPGSASKSSFFNQSVRHALALPYWQQQKAQAFHLFKCLLQSAEKIFISHTGEINGEYIPSSPWLSSLSDFASQALDINLYQNNLSHLLSQLQQQHTQNTANLPTESKQPKPVIPDALIPQTYSATRYQRLINCPYLFFAADVLMLRASDEIKDSLQKPEYGEKVHHILHLFHQQISLINADNRTPAIELLKQLSQTEFTKDLEDNVHHRGWLKRWLDIIPAYIDWQIERQQTWHIDKMEQKLETTIKHQYQLRGRLDRIDKQQHQFSIIDYKTGRTASQADVNSGEDVQLVSYAMLMDDVQEVTYLSLDKTVKNTATLYDDELDELKQLNLQRLESLLESLQEGAALSAWGDEKVCGFCDMSGLCRKQSWQA